jgi:hypothetical protein
MSVNHIKTVESIKPITNTRYEIYLSFILKILYVCENSQC